MPSIIAKSNLNVNAIGSKQRAFTWNGSANRRSPHGDKDRGFIAGCGGPASGMDRRRVGGEASESKPVDAPGERLMIKRLGTREATWPSAALNRKSSAEISG